jgi:carbonic anhydrase
MTPEDLFVHNRAWAAQIERERPGFFTRLSAQQRPKFMWIGCSDSRVPANQITGLDPGEVFVHRNVANLVVHADLNALSAIQYAVQVLKVSHVMVVGHYGCGGVLAAATGQRVGLADNWLRHVRDVQEKYSSLLAPLSLKARADALVDLNVIEQVANLCGTTVVQDAWQAGQDLTVHGWAYGLHNGLLEDLRMSVNSADDAASVRQQALGRVIAVHANGLRP